MSHMWKLGSLHIWHIWHLIGVFVFGIYMAIITCIDVAACCLRLIYAVMLVLYVHYSKSAGMIYSMIYKCNVTAIFVQCSFVDIFVSGTCMARTCEIDVVVGCVLEPICTNVRFIYLYRMRAA